MVTVRYAVSDGLSDPVDGKVSFRVQDPNEDRGVAPVTNPDVVSVEAGGTVTVEPLANDMPGSDPGNPDAQLSLAGRLASAGGATVRTDLASGRVVFRAPRPRTYFLTYDAAYGNAPVARGRIRIDVRPRQTQAPIAMPDTTTVYGQAPTLVDVLANDVDPGGGLLVVQNSRARDPDQIETAIVDGRWLRISPRQGELSPAPQVVRYVVGSGSRTAVGEVTVMWRPAPGDNAPVTEVDAVTVRAGSSVVVPVLDNDYSPSGDPLTLQRDVVEGRAGELPVTAATGGAGRAGQAFVSGRLVRYVAPTSVGEGQVVHVDYVAVNTAQESAPGRLDVTVIPSNRPNRPPEPPLLQGRVVAGGTLKLTLPGANVDPDGDAVSLVGLATAPRLGRLVSFGANSMEYQAYPGSAGTEQFAYTLTDPLGGVATGVVRVAVVPPGEPQPPVAVSDEITVEPGRSAVVDLAANDLVAPGDRATGRAAGAPGGRGAALGSGQVRVQAPRAWDAPAR
ncbi:MAG: Ig-like domain-containing protein [Nocardioides sp.]